MLTACCDVYMGRVRDYSCDWYVNYCTKCFSILGVFTGEDEFLMLCDNEWYLKERAV
jgi:hypothetical protein